MANPNPEDKPKLVSAFDQLIVQLIETLGQLAQHHVQEVEELSSQIVAQRQQTAKLRESLSDQKKQADQQQAQSSAQTREHLPGENFLGVRASNVSHASSYLLLSHDVGSIGDSTAESKKLSSKSLSFEIDDDQPPDPWTMEALGSTMSERAAIHQVTLSDESSCASTPIDHFEQDDQDELEIGDGEASILSCESKKPLAHRMYAMRQPWLDHMDYDRFSLQEVLIPSGKDGIEDLDSIKKADRLSLAIRPGEAGASRLSIGMGSHDLTGSHHTRHRRQSRCMMHPKSKRRAMWLFICAFFLIYDLIMVPLTLSFQTTDSGMLFAIQIFAATFWTLDIPFTFRSGVVTETHTEMNPLRIARIYLKSWLILDATLVLIDWVLLVASTDDDSVFAKASGARWTKMIRLLKLLRFSRILKLRPLLRQKAFQYQLSMNDIDVTWVWLSLTSWLLVAIHLVACAWHLLGDSVRDGWVELNNLEGGSTGRRYVVSVRWTCARLLGIYSGRLLETSMELVVDTIFILASLIGMSLYLAKVTSVMQLSASEQHASLKTLGANFARRNGISFALRERLMRYIDASLKGGGAIDVAADEARLLKGLPSVLREDLLYEVRTPVLRHLQVFDDMYSVNPRVLRHVCTQAMSLVVAVDEQLMFADGDACNRTLFVTSGGAWYTRHVKKDFAGTPSVAAQFQPSGSKRTENGRQLLVPVLQDGAYASKEFIQKHGVISEAVLWTNWEHRGSVISAEESMYLGLDAAEFGNVIIQHKEASIHAVKYAKRFVKQLNMCEPTDLTSFDNMSIVELDEVILDGAEEDHFVFISHYKVEAGTEATLMREMMEQILAEDPTHEVHNLLAPVFVDSEDLTDLAKLKEHVENSHAIVLLLTPGLLLRPWCLIELVTAFNEDVILVPVEIQRPGVAYQYPDESFYTALVSGDYLPEDAMELLAKAGVELSEVEMAIREMFLRIALPFSPHKSKPIRYAELQDILKRCKYDHGAATSQASIFKSSPRRPSQRFPVGHIPRAVSGHL